MTFVDVIYHKNQKGVKMTVDEFDGQFSLHHIIFNVRPYHPILSMATCEANSTIHNNNNNNNNNMISIIKDLVQCLIRSSQSLAQKCHVFGKQYIIACSRGTFIYFGMPCKLYFLKF